MSSEKAKLSPRPTARSKRYRWISTTVLLFLYLLVTSPYSPVSPSRRVSSESIERLTTHNMVAHSWDNNGLTDQVQWDKYGLSVRDQRIFLHSGELHPWRLPVPTLWLDVLQKIKALGFNSISVYTHMGLSNPSSGVVDMEGFRALEPLFDAAMQTGLWIVLRPGPYINAETSAGGLPHWLTSEVAGRLRSNATDFNKAWKPYIVEVIRRSLKHQITEGGPIIAIQIDNEYVQTESNGEYFAQLQKIYRETGIVVPLTFNDAYQGKNFINGTGAVDVYGLDTYPQRFDCSKPSNWNPVVTNYHEYHMDANPHQPFYIPEAQAGSFDAWGPNAPGYDACRILTGPDFESVFNLNWWASNAKMINHYMIMGGTSWGNLPFPGVYTSYDYGSAISESRELTAKYTELKRQGLFLRSSVDFRKTDWIVDSKSEHDLISPSEAAFVTLLRNPDSGAEFYILRHHNSSSKDIENFRLTVGDLSLPQVASSVTLGPRQSKLVVVDYSFGQSKLLYSTAQVLYASKIGHRDVLFVYGDYDQEHELSLQLRGTPRQVLQPSSRRFMRSDSTGGQTIINILAGVSTPGGLVTLYDSSEQLVLFADTDTAGTFWSPLLPTEDPATPFANFWQLGTNASILVGGPYFVRSAALRGTHLTLRGDLSTSATLTVIAPDVVRSISWNGDLVESSTGSSLVDEQVFIGAVKTKKSFNALEIPPLTSWKYADSLPEIQSDFDDSNWVIADHTTTNLPYPMHYGDGTVLYGCDYGFCEGAVLWRGHFKASGHEASVNLSINGGQAFAASVWINDVFIKTTYGNSSNNMNIIKETDEVYHFPRGSLRPGEDNVITILQDNMGLDEAEDDDSNTSKSPRGVRGFALDQGTQFTTWKVQGKVGGYTSFPDKVRGVLNEGGLYAERCGWHLPGFNTSTWSPRELSSGLPKGKAGVGMFTTTFPLNIASYLDVLLAFTFDNKPQPYRAILFINGWSMGKRVANLGPQYRFPVPQGILDYNGVNTISVALWSMEDVKLNPSLEITLGGVFEGDSRTIPVNNPKWSLEGRVDG